MTFQGSTSLYNSFSCLFSVVKIFLIFLKNSDIFILHTCRVFHVGVYQLKLLPHCCWCSHLTRVYSCIQSLVMVSCTGKVLWLHIVWRIWKLLQNICRHEADAISLWGVSTYIMKDSCEEFRIWSSTQTVLYSWHWLKWMIGLMTWLVSASSAERKLAKCPTHKYVIC